MKKKKLELLDIMPRAHKKQKVYELVPHVEDVAGEQILVIEMYYSMNDDVSYRVFLGQTDYITLNMHNDEWTHRDILELTGVEWWKSDKRKRSYWVDEEDEKVISEFVGRTIGSADKDAAWKIYRYQEKKREDKRKSSQQRVTDTWDAKIGILPLLPKDWKQFTEKECIRKQFIYYHRAEKDKGICTYCENTVPLQYARHNIKSRCPSCGKYVTLKDLERPKNYGTATGDDAWLIQKDNERLILRRYYVYKSVDNTTFMKREVGVAPMEMVIMNLKGEILSKWLYESYKDGPRRWIPDYAAKGYSLRGEEGSVYKGNMAEWKEYLANPYLPLEIMPYNTQLNAVHLFDQTNLEYHQAAEKLMKIGLWNLGACAIWGRIMPDKKISRMLKTENDDLEILKSIDADYDQYRLFQELKKLGKRPTADELEQYICTDIPERIVLKLAKYTTWHQIYKRYRFNSAGILSHYYNDYYNMCKELNFDMKSSFVLFPKNIKKAHDDLTLYYNEKKDEIEGKRRNKVYGKVAEMAAGLNELYGVENEEYLIRAPRDAAEIIKEGHAMHHCVGGKSYTENMMKGYSYILFIRKKSDPEKAWYTMEMKHDHTVIQVRGFSNQDKDKIRETSIWKLLTQRLNELRQKAAV